MNTHYQDYMPVGMKFKELLSDEERSERYCLMNPYRVRGYCDIWMMNTAETPTHKIRCNEYSNWGFYYDKSWANMMVKKLL